MHTLVRNLAGVEGNETFVCTAVTRANDLVALPSGMVGLFLETATTPSVKKSP